MFGFFVRSDFCMLAGFAFHDSGHNNADCGVDRCSVNFLPSPCILSLAGGHMLVCPNSFSSSQASDNFLLLYSKKRTRRRSPHSSEWAPSQNFNLGSWRWVIKTLKSDQGGRLPFFSKEQNESFRAEIW